MKPLLLRVVVALAVLSLTLSACASVPVVSVTPTAVPTQAQQQGGESTEAGPRTISGSVAYTNPFFTAGVAQPLVILEDQGGFVTRDRQFVFPV